MDASDVSVDRREANSRNWHQQVQVNIISLGRPPGGKSAKLDRINMKV